MRLSQKQYTLLLYIARRSFNIISWDEIATVNQITLNSMLYNRYVIEAHDHSGLVLTKKGTKTLHDFSHADYRRKNQYAPLGSKVRKIKVHTFKKQGIWRVA